MKRSDALLIGSVEKDDLASSLHGKIRVRLDRHYTSMLVQRLVELDDLAQLLRNQLQRYQQLSTAGSSREPGDHTALDRFFKEHNGLIVKGIEKKYASKDQSSDFLDTGVFFGALEDLLQDFPEFVLHEQQRERFYTQPGDPFRVRFLKPLKRLVYGFSVFPRRALNLVRKLFGKSSIRVPLWSQRVPFRRWSAYCYTGAMVRELSDHFDGFMQIYTRILDDLVGIENAISEHMILRRQEPDGGDNLDIGRSISEVDRCREEIEQAKGSELQSIRDILHRQFDVYITGLHKAGTLELPSARLSGRRVQKQRRRSCTALEMKASQWFNAVFLAYRDWMFDLEIYGLVDKIWDEQSAVDRVVHERIVDKLLPGLARIQSTFDGTLQKLQAMYDREEGLRKQLLAEKLAANRDAESGAAAKLAQEVIDLDFPGLINGLHGRTHAKLKMLSTECWLVKKEKLLMPVRDSEISVFSPVELLNFESLPNLEKALNKYKVVLLRTVGDFSHEIESLPRILQFNIDTALEVLQAGAEQQADARKLIDQGFERIQNKIDDLGKMVRDFESMNRKELKNIFGQFNRHVLDLTDNENALNVRLRLTKAIALRKTVVYRQRVFGKLKNAWTRTRRYSKVYWAIFLTFIRPWQKRMGLHKVDEIAPELSDFLSYSYQVINGLPLVYRKLYSIHPLQSHDLFVDRNVELKKVQNALSNWQKGRYASTVVVGEKWSGLTSLINMSLDSIEQKHRTIRISPEGSQYRTGRLTELFESVQAIGSRSDVDDLIQHIHRVPGKPVMVVEDLQKLYVRRVHGFALLRDLFRLISATSDHVFWLCTCTRYAWSYLDQAINISGHFGYVIDLQDMKDQTITDIILRRNSISGYRIHYSPSTKLLKNKKFIALDGESQQQFLKRQFFSNLNAFARSNISLALLYWLLSTKMITEEGIEIGHFEKPDFTFLERISFSKTMGLYMLVVHDGLPSGLFSELMEMEEEQGMLLLNQLVEDGLVVRKAEDYFVNTLLYRPAVNMLKSKNLIY